jgi:hypothetical protein
MKMSKIGNYIIDGVEDGTIVFNEQDNCYELYQDFEESWGKAMAYANQVMSTPEFEADMKEWLDKDNNNNL